MTNLPPIFIPTRGRVGELITTKYIPKSYFEDGLVWLVTPPGERHDGLPTISVPSEVADSLPAKRDWIAKEAARRGFDRHVQIDDDVRFSKNRFSPLPMDFAQAMHTFSAILDRSGHVGAVIGSGHGFTNTRPAVSFNSAVGGVVCLYRHSAIGRNRFSHVAVQEDLHMHCSMLESGYSVATCFVWGFDNIGIIRGRTRPGGLSGDPNYASIDVYDRELERVVDRHPGILSATHSAVPSKGTKPSFLRITRNYRRFATAQGLPTNDIGTWTDLKKMISRR